MIRIFLISLSFAASLMASTVFASDRTEELDKRHKDCLERIAMDQELALEEAMIWRDQGGGRRARHCEAMALFALGHEDEAAHRLDQLASGADGGSDVMRSNFRLEAANFWLAAAEAEKAKASVMAGLEYETNHTPLRISLARAEALAERYDAAEDELDKVISLEPGHAEALRYRADIRMRQGRLAGAKDDIEASLMSDPESVETALLRGHINEAIRTSKLTPNADE